MARVDRWGSVFRMACRYVWLVWRTDIVAYTEKVVKPVILHRILMLPQETTFRGWAVVDHTAISDRVDFDCIHYTSGGPTAYRVATWEPSVGWEFLATGGDIDIKRTE